MTVYSRPDGITGLGMGVPHTADAAL